jgi:hypothetical protein
MRGFWVGQRRSEVFSIFLVHKIGCFFGVEYLGWDSACIFSVHIAIGRVISSTQKLST